MTFLSPLPALLFPLLLCCLGCAEAEPAVRRVQERPDQPVQLIPLSGLLKHPEIEISGLAWYGDRLVFLPQRPFPPSSGTAGRLFYISKETLRAHLDGRSEGAPVPREIPFDPAGVEERVPGFEGFEAIAFHGDRAFLTIEAKYERGMHGYLVAAEVAPDLSRIRLDPQSLTEIPMPVDILNMSYEALLVAEDRVIALYEANGVNINPGPQAFVFDLDLRPLGTIPFPAVEYRITDATMTDACGQFWGINYYYPGEYHLLHPEPDVLASGPGEPPLRQEAVERLVSFMYRGSEIVRRGRAPLSFQRLADGRGRNWEGLARLDDRGFLVITDQFPTTMLAFLPFPEGEPFAASEDCE